MGPANGALKIESVSLRLCYYLSPREDLKVVPQVAPSGDES